MTAPYCPPLLQGYYLGSTVGGKWINFVNGPDLGYNGTLDPGIAVQQLLSGGVATQRQAKTRRTYVLTFTGLTPDTGDQLVSSIYGLLGTGPYYFVDPMYRNVLPGHIASCGLRRQNSTGFIPSASNTVAYTSAVAPPTSAPLSGVQSWVATINGTLGCGQSAAAVNQSDMTPVIAGVPITFGRWIRSLAGTTITATAQFCDSTGASVGTVVLSPTWASTSTWTRFSATCAPGSFPAGAVTASLTLKSSAATTINLAAMDDQYVTASVLGANGTLLPAWVLGLGVPKMLIVAPMNSNHGGRTWRRDQDLTLAETA